MVKKLAFHIALCLLVFNSQAQDYIIRQFPPTDTLPKDEGPNYKHYFAETFGIGTFFGLTDSSGSNINPQRSSWITIGFRHKAKISSFFNTGTDLYIALRSFNIAQTDEKVFGGQFKHKKEKFTQLSFNYSFFMRFNLVKRGNHLGKYFDLFGSAAFSPFNRHTTWDKIDPVYGMKAGKSVFSKLQYAQKFYYEVGARYGISFLQFQFTYRPSRLFKKTDQFPYPELPRFAAGIIIDIDNNSNREYTP